MKSLILGVLILAILVAIFGMVLVNPPPMPWKSLAFTLRTTPNGQTGSKSISVVLSNTSQHSVLFPAGFGQPWFKVEYQTNGVWAHSSVRTPGGGEELLRSGQSIQSSINVPEASQAVRVRLRVTSLTWRGRFSLWLFSHGNLFILGPIEGYLAGEEQRRRSTNECSDVLFIAP